MLRSDTLRRHAQPRHGQSAHVLGSDIGQRDPRDHDLGRPAAQIAPEHRQVVGERDGGGRHHDQVVEQDRPARDEAPELVERVAGEAGGAATLDVKRAPFDVGRNGHHQEQPCEQVDDRSEPECVSGHDSEREEDRGGDRAEHDREQRRFSQTAGDARLGPFRAASDLGTRAARHRRAPFGAGVAHRRRPRASHSRPAPSRANIVPRITPRASAPPPRASADATMATPTSTSSPLSARVDARYARCTPVS